MQIKVIDETKSAQATQNVLSVQLPKKLLSKSSSICHLYKYLWMKLISDIATAWFLWLNQIGAPRRMPESDIDLGGTLPSQKIIVV